MRLIDGYLPIPPFRSLLFNLRRWLWCDLATANCCPGITKRLPMTMAATKGGLRSKTCNWAEACTIHHPSPYITIHHHTRYFWKVGRVSWYCSCHAVLCLRLLTFSTCPVKKDVWCFDWTSHKVKLWVYQAIMYFQRALQQRVGTVALPRWATQPAGI